jgi:hypothetical protein
MIALGLHETRRGYIDSIDVDLYIHSHIRLHGVVLNSLSTGTTLPYIDSIGHSFV